MENGYFNGFYVTNNFDITLTPNTNGYGSVFLEGGDYAYPVFKNVEEKKFQEWNQRKKQQNLLNT